MIAVKLKRQGSQITKAKQGQKTNVVTPEFNKELDALVEQNIIL